MRNGFGSMCFGLILVQGLFSVGFDLFSSGWFKASLGLPSG